MSQDHQGLLEVRVESIRYAARDTYLVEMVAPTGAVLPAVTPGAHIDLHLGNGLTRSYSLVHSGDDLRAYIVGIKLDPASRGGSRYVHEKLRVGSLMKVSYPRNHFPLKDDAPHSVLLAGGIGITPIWCMACHLQAIGASWELWYSARARADAALLDEMAPFINTKVHCHFDDEEGGFLDLKRIVHNAPSDAHLYCCGPTPMLDAYEQAGADRDPQTMHLERFAPKEAAALDGGYAVRLERSGKELTVPPGISLLQVLLDNGVNIDYSCRDGICGCCEVAVLAGEIDHRDSVLTDAEKAQNKTMMVCCSGAKSAKITLDL